MSRRIDKKPRFRNDLLENFLYLGERDLDVAIRFLAAVQEACRKLAEMPGMGSRREFVQPALKEIRSWPVRGFDNYLIFYRPVDEGIEVLRVVHGARDIEKLFE